MEWKNEKRLISELKEYPNNPRIATKEMNKNLSESISKFNVSDPLIINTNNEVIGGNFRLFILKQKNIKEVDVRVPDKELTREESDELNIRLNKNTGEWNFDLLANFDNKMLLDVGFTTKELLKVDDIDDLTQKELNDVYEVVIECENEEEQREVFEQLQNEGKKCRISTF